MTATTTLRTNSGRKRAVASARIGDEVSNGYFLLLFLVATLCAFGLMMVLSSSSVDALRTYKNSWVFFKRQVIWLGLGAIALTLMLRTDYRSLRKVGLPMLLASVGLLFLVLVPGIGVSVSGSRRWLGAGSLRMQPSEIAKFGILIFSSDLLTRRRQLVDDWRAILRPVGLMFGLLAALIMLQPDMGTTMIIGAIAVVILFVGGTSTRHLGRAGLAIAAGATLLALLEPYRRARMTSFLNPFKDASNGGYQVVQSLIGIGSGGITGVGLGASRSKWGFLPNAHTDFIFAVIAEELGLIGAVAVVLLYVGFGTLGVRAASNAPDRFGMLVASGITAWVVFQALLNIGAVVGVLPVTGVPLPFLSQGGSSLVILMAATGVLLNIARQGEVCRKQGQERAS